MNQVLKYRNEIYGFLALWILFFHVKTRVGLGVYIPFFNSFLDFGNLGVDVFLFLSGFCLCLSLQRDSSITHFYAKRFKRVVIAYLIIAVPFFIWKSIEETTSYRFMNFFYDLTGLSFWFSGVQNAWFVEAILVFYIITPFVFRIVKKGILHSLVLISLLYVALVLAHYYIPFIHRCEIACTRLPIYIIGMVLAYYKPHFEFKHQKVAIIIFIVEAIIVLYIGQRMGGFWCWLFYAIMVIPALWLLKELFSVIPVSVNKVFSIIGTVSLEIYLIHIMTLHVFTFYGWNATVDQWMYLILPAITLPLSFIVPRISSAFLSRGKTNLIQK